jgi:hypothetical protein
LIIEVEGCLYEQTVFLYSISTNARIKCGLPELFAVWGVAWRNREANLAPVGIVVPGVVLAFHPVTPLGNKGIARPGGFAL